MGGYGIIIYHLHGRSKRNLIRRSPAGKGFFMPAELDPRDFTQIANEVFYDTVDDPYFRDRDLDSIYEVLIRKIRAVPFGDYLKRYIYQKARMEGDYSAVPVAEYRQIICDEFAERQTPASFEPTTARLRNIAKNWLEQRSVSRSVVLLLGFGLGMSTEDVNEFLTKVLKEQGLNAKDPFEVICWYCYTNGYTYPKFEQLWSLYRDREKKPVPAGSLENTSVFRQRLLSIKNEDLLWRYLDNLPIQPGTFRQSVMCREQFDLLYAKTCEWVADVMNEMEDQDASVDAERLQERLDHTDRYYDFEKREMLAGQKERKHRAVAADITPADVERVILASVPKDKNGNLMSMKTSTLNTVFSGARLSRQHIGEILAGRAPITRNDLLTLSFFAFGKSMDDYDSRLARYRAFLDATNAVLKSSDMEEIYLANPYEIFIVMCMLSDDPVGTFSDVWERSYADEGEE